ncbi:MAG: hypothetical protein WDW36_007464 [Sanguina aurantia]
MQHFKRILLIRHGECEVGGRANESPLTALGIQQATALGRHFSNPMDDSCTIGPTFSSTAARARHTARIALDAAGKQDVSITETEQLLEISQGDWEGRLRSQVYTESTVASIAADPYSFAAPGGESQRGVEVRMMAFVTETVLPRLTAGGPPAVIVGHGMAIKCLLRGILDSKPQMSRMIWIDNTSITEVAWNDAPGAEHGWHVARVNDAAHLHKEGLYRSSARQLAASATHAPLPSASAAQS